MKVGKQRLYRQISGLMVLSTFAICTAFTVAKNDYTYSMHDVKEAKVEQTDGEEPSSSLDVESVLISKIEKMIENKKEKDRLSQVVFDGLTLEELTEKLEKNLNSILKGKGKLFAEYSIELGLDPYLATSIVLLETGCSWECSQLVKQCNNVGGIKGSGACFGTAYASYPSLDSGIKSYLRLLYNGYYKQGLTTPELINPKYAESKDWAAKVNKYMNQIKAS